MAAMPDASVDLVVTDPPYGARYRDRSGRTVANDDNTAWLTPAFAQVARVLKDHRFCVSFYGWHQADRFLAAWRAAGLRPVGHLVWVKSYHSNGTPRFLRYRHEAAYLLAKGFPRPTEAINDVLGWEYTGNRRHPTEKPVSAIEPLIEAFSRPGDLVLDPFAGSGTTAVAAQELGRRYVAIELDPRYCEAARERLSGK
jgi:site-specific DNA-methyltransferase (adenine-specific)